MIGGTGSAEGSTSLCYISLFLGCWNITYPDLKNLAGQLTNQRVILVCFLLYSVSIGYKLKKKVEIWLGVTDPSLTPRLWKIELLSPREVGVEHCVTPNRISWKKLHDQGNLANISAVCSYFPLYNSPLGQMRRRVIKFPRPSLEKLCLVNIAYPLSTKEF